MCKTENGSVIFLALLTITVLMIMVTASSYMLNNEIQIASYSENQVKALYLAEAGIEESINIMNDTPSEFQINDLPLDIKQSVGEDYNGTYEIIGEDTKKINDNLYEIKVKGKINGVTKGITVNIKIEINNSETFDNVLASGKQIQSDSSKADITGNIAAGSGNIPQFDFEDLKAEADNENRLFDSNGFKSEYNITDKGRSDDTIELSAGVTYIAPTDTAGKLTLDLNGQTVTGPSADSPAVVVVNGDLELQKPNETLANVYFITTGKIRTDNNTNKLTTDNTLMYSADDGEDAIELAGNNLEYSGVIMSAGGIDIDNVKGGNSTINYQEINLNSLSAGLIVPTITSWEE